MGRPIDKKFFGPTGFNIKAIMVDGSVAIWVREGQAAPNNGISILDY